MSAVSAYDDVIFDFCDVLVDWRPRRAVDGLFPDDVLDRLFDKSDPFGFWHYDILSDLGWSEERILAEYAARHDIGADESRRIIDEVVGVGDAGSAAASDVGVVSVDAVRANGLRSHGTSDEPAESDAVRRLRAFATYFARQRLALAGMLPGMAELLRDLDAAGVRCWGLTNFTVKYVEAARELFPALGILKDVVVSSAERIHKPDAEIYRRAVARFGVDPAHTAFVDDKQRNADAAAAAVPGLTGIRFIGEASLRPLLLG
ncbi:HAD-IA family hydrolase [Bifidobacterium sp. MA2]|uniref:HAD-IA family hydrolase n=1 Tax=Bifidobacterium santillanense TaxID=2809028 RepID=A0ABS5UST3_9BIFI|nr:HAD-IA family hydrolase [Bifidobacterium santillanense]MBT1173779.1 HAD-IA family hydrolase [Bifidobacterium santillanense]